MRLSHVNITMPPGGREAACEFYGELLRLPELPMPDVMRARGGVWFDLGGLDLHISIEEERAGRDVRRHFGLESEDVDAVRARLEAAGVTVDPGRPAPWKRFFAYDPFGNRIEIHEAGAMRE